MFQKEKYLEINNFEVRQILCRFRISSHHLRVETERHKNNSIEISEDIIMLSKTEFLTFNNKFFYFIYRIVTLNEINMRFYGAEYT
jgi:hypothetical protein